MTFFLYGVALKIHYLSSNNFFNHSSEHLKFTIDYEECQVNFLGLLIIKDNDKLVTDLNRKPTDRNTVLHGQSFILHLKKNLLNSQFKRIHRICTIMKCVRSNVRI